MSVRDGRIISTFGQVGGSDEVWFDPASRTCFLAASDMTSNGEKTGYATRARGDRGRPVSAWRGAGRWLGNFPTAVSAHSVAANPGTQVTMMPYGWLSSWQVTRHAYFCHPTRRGVLTWRWSTAA
jgi:hypothetical protein